MPHADVVVSEVTMHDVTNRLVINRMPLDENGEVTDSDSYDFTIEVRGNGTVLVHDWPNDVFYEVNLFDSKVRKLSKAPVTSRHIGEC